MLCSVTSVVPFLCSIDKWTNALLTQPCRKLFVTKQSENWRGIQPYCCSYCIRCSEVYASAAELGLQMDIVLMTEVSFVITRLYTNYEYCNNFSLVALCSCYNSWSVKWHSNYKIFSLISWVSNIVKMSFFCLFSCTEVGSKFITTSLTLMVLVTLALLVIKANATEKFKPNQLLESKHECDAGSF